MITLDYAGSPGIEYRTQATVVAAQLLASDSGYTSKQKLEIPRPGMTHLYYRVPAGVSALRVDVQSSQAEAVGVDHAAGYAHRIDGDGGERRWGRRWIRLRHPRQQQRHLLGERAGRRDVGDTAAGRR